MLLFLITILLILFAILAWRRIDIATGLVIFLLPTYLIRFTVLGIPFTLLEGMILILFLVWVIKQKNKITFTNYKWWILALLVFSTLSVLIAPDRMAALGIWKAYFVEPLMLFLVLINYPRLQSGKARAVISPWVLVTKALSASALVVAIPAIIQKWWPIGIANSFWAEEATRRVTSWYGFPNAVGLYLAPIVVLLVGWLLVSLLERRRDKSRLYGYFGIIALSVGAIIFARSEGAVIGVLAGIIFLGIFYPSKKRRRSMLRLYILAGVIISMAFIPSVRSYIVEKASLSDLSGQIRLQQWRETSEMLQDGRMLSGVGLSGYPMSVEPYHQEGIFYNFENDSDFQRKLVWGDDEYKATHWQPTEIYQYPHNFFLNFWSEIGLLGMLTMIVLMLKMVINYWKIKNPDNRKYYIVLLAVMATIFVHGLVDVQYFKNDLSVLWWLLFGLSWVVVKAKKEIELKS